MVRQKCLKNRIALIVRCDSHRMQAQWRSNRAKAQAPLAMGTQFVTRRVQTTAPGRNRCHRRYCLHRPCLRHPILPALLHLQLPLAQVVPIMEPHRALALPQAAFRCLCRHQCSQAPARDLQSKQAWDSRQLLLGNLSQRIRVAAMTGQLRQGQIDRAAGQGMRRRERP